MQPYSLGDDVRAAIQGELRLWDAGAAWTAIAAYYASHRGWVIHSEDLLTAGLREAYCNGLAIALPTGPDELGWVMEHGE